MDEKAWAKVYEVIYHANNDYIRHKKEEQETKEKMLENLRMGKEVAHAGNDNNFRHRIIKITEEIVEDYLKKQEEDEIIFWEGIDFQFELSVQEYWRPCPKCEICQESAYGSFEPPWSWCEMQRGKRKKYKK